MATPSKSEIEERARELYHEEHARQGDPSFAIEPEPEELKEGGYLNAAASELMRSENSQWSIYGESLQKPKQPQEPERKLCESARDVPFDVALAVDSGFYISGTSQSGKSNLAKCIVQKLIEKGIRVFVVDPSRAWTHDSPISNVLPVDTRISRYAWHGSTVFDISTLNARQKVLFANQLCKDRYEMHVNGLEQKEFIIFEEAQTYIPSGSMRLAVRRSSPCESILDVVTVGANYGLRFGLITQFPALVDKPPVKITQQRYFGWTWERNDISYVKAFLGKEWIAKLCALQKGEFIYQCRERTELIRTARYGQFAKVEGFNYQYGAISA